MSGKLYICPTPIGNLEDITMRVLRVLNQVDLIAAEDTRHTIKLLNHYDIQKKMISYHEHNKIGAGKRIIDLLNDGNDIALVSDAGMPGISDPGEEIIKCAIDNNIEFEILPGPSAVINALVGSGMPTDSFMFLGFISRDKKKMKEVLLKYEKVEMPIIIYEAPHRILRTLEFISNIYGNREIAICRELSKKHEEYYRTTMEEAIKRYSDIPPKGEIVVVIGSAKEVIKEIEFKAEDIIDIIESSSSSKEAVKSLMEVYSISKNQAYALVLENKAR